MHDLHAVLAWVHQEHGAALEGFGGADEFTVEVDGGVLRGYVHLHLAGSDSACEVLDGATTVEIDTDGLAGFVDRMIHRLNLSDLLLIPTGKWRNVFDAVAFSLATNEAWQEFDQSATVELNTRDPLLCGPADFPLLVDLVRALMSDADKAEQGLTMIPTSVPIVAEVTPEGAVRLSIGNQALADEIMEAVAV